MIKFWIITIAIFILITYGVQKVIYKYARGREERKKNRWNIYHWEALVAISSGLTFVVLYILKSLNQISF